LAAVLGPALPTTITKLIVVLAVFPLGRLAVFVIDRSALVFTTIVAVLRLFVGVLSAVVVVTVLVAVTGPLAGTVKLSV
jgi:hypothetical protein